MTAELDAIVRDVRMATRRDVSRRAHRRRRATHALAATFAAATLSTGVATATGSFPALSDLFEGDRQGLETTATAPGVDEVVLNLTGQVAGGGRVRGAVTDLGSTSRSRTVPGAAVCESDGAGLLACQGAPTGTATSLGPPPTAPAGTRVYRVKPQGAAGVTEQVFLIPAQRLQLIVVGTFPGATAEPPPPPPGSTERGR
jgi:hypothetical protein